MTKVWILQEVTSYKIHILNCHPIMKNCLSEIHQFESADPVELRKCISQENVTYLNTFCLQTVHTYKQSCFETQKFIN